MFTINLLYTYSILTIYLLYIDYINIYSLVMVCIYITSNAGFQYINLKMIHTYTYIYIHVYCTFIYVTSNAGFQIYRITIIHIHISTISNIFYLQDFDRFMKGYWSQKTFPPLPSRLSCALFFPKPPWLQQNASGRKYILSVTYATNFIENT